MSVGKSNPYGAVSSGAVASLTSSQVVPGSSYRMLRVVVITPLIPISTVKYNGIPLTLQAISVNDGVVGGTNATGIRVEYWTLIGPPIGTYDIVVTPVSSCRVILSSQVFDGVDPTTPFGDFYTPVAGPPVQTISTDVLGTYGSDSLVDEGVGIEALAVPGWTIGAGQTLGHDDADAYMRCITSSEPGNGGTVTMSGTTSTAVNVAIAQIAVEILPYIAPDYTIPTPPAAPISATPAFLKEARRFDAPLTALVKVYLTSPTTRTLYLATNFVETADYQLWEAGIVKFEGIREPGSFLSPGPDRSTAGFSLATRHGLGFQPITKNISNLFADYRWQGAKVEIYLWSKRLTSFTDACRRWVGIVQNYKIHSDTVDVSCIQRDDWDRIVSPVLVARDKYPRCPDRSVGLPLPIIYGRITAPPLRQPPWASDLDPQAGYSPVNNIERIAGGTLGIPVIAIDTGRGNGNQRSRLAIAGHKIRSHADAAVATSYFLRDSDLLVPIYPSTFTVPNCTTAGTTTLTTSDNFLTRGVRVGMPISGTDIPAGAYVAAVTATSLTLSAAATGAHSPLTMTFTAAFNDTDGAGLELADDFSDAGYPIWPTAVPTGISNPGDDLGRLLDPTNDTAFARLTYQPSPLIDKRRGEWLLRDVGPRVNDIRDNNALGVYVRCMYKSSAALTNFKVGLRNQARAIETLGTLAASTTPTFALVAVGGAGWGTGALPDNPWAFSQCRLVAYWSTVPGARQDVWLYPIGLEVQYRPKAKVWAPGFTLQRDPNRLGRHYIELESYPIDSMVDADFYGTVEGHADDGSGTYTGVAGALIERAVDIANHFLRTYGGQSSGQVETGASVFGSLIDARTPMKTWKGTDWKAALLIAEKSKIGTWLEALAKASLSWCYIDSFTDKWLWIPWLKGGGTDYARKIYRDDLISFETDIMPANRVPSGIDVKYGWDGRSRRFIWSSSCSVSGSKAGHRYQNLRDESMKITASVNDKLDFAVAGFNGAATISPSDYADIATFCAAVDAAMETAAAASDFMVCSPERVVAGYNDKLNVNDGAAKLATLTPGTMTMEQRAVDVAAALNAVSSGWTCTYDRTTKKFTIDRTSGTKTLLLSTGANKTTTGFVNLGYSSEQGDISAGTAGKYQVEEYRIVLECLTGAMDLLFATGTNGSTQAAPKSCAEALGFDGAFDRDAQGARRTWLSDTPKGFREKVLNDAATAYGSTRELAIEARALYETDSARELRNRIIDLTIEPRVFVRWKTTRMPDVHRGELVRFDDLDNFGLAFPKQASDGLWAGKRFRVISIVQRLGPTFEQEIEAIENN